MEIMSKKDQYNTELRIKYEFNQLVSISHVSDMLSHRYKSKIRLDIENHTWLNNPKIQEVLQDYQLRGGFGSNTVINSDICQEKKYAIEQAGVTYASGICTKKYNEEILWK